MTKQTEQGAAPTISTTSPTHIYLDLGELDADQSGVSFSDLREVTWSENNATGHGIRYIRADLANPAPEGCALGNRDLPNFDPADLTIDSFPRRPPGGMQVGMSVGVLVRHKPSGFSVIVDNHRSQHRNRDEALRQLAFLVHVFGDMPAATSHPTPKE